MRHTTVTPEGSVPQTQLDRFWDLIETNYAEDWRWDYDGSVLLEVDDAMLRRICADHPEAAELDFETYEMHNPESERWEWVNLPEHLTGTYIIKGIYNAKQQRLDVQREYFFTQEGF